MRFTLLSAAIIALSGLAAAPASATSEIRSVEADAYGNAIIRTTGGAKIIAVGQAALASATAPSDAQQPTVIEADDAVPACREVGVLLRGRSHMYGVSDGDPVPTATRVICN